MMKLRVGWLNRRASSVVARATAEPMEPRRLLSTVSWDGGGDGVNWTSPANWSTDSLPTAADDVVISPGGTITVRLSGATVAGRSLSTYLTVLKLENNARLELTGAGQSFLNQLDLFSGSVFCSGLLVATTLNWIRGELGGSGGFQFSNGTVQGTNLKRVTSTVDVADLVTISGTVTLGDDSNTGVVTGILSITFGSFVSGGAAGGTVNATDIRKVGSSTFTFGPGVQVNSGGVRVETAGGILRASNMFLGSLTSNGSSGGPYPPSQPGLLDVGSLTLYNGGVLCKLRLGGTAVVHRSSILGDVEGGELVGLDRSVPSILRGTLSGTVVRESCTLTVVTDAPFSRTNPPELGGYLYFPALPLTSRTVGFLPLGNRYGESASVDVFSNARFDQSTSITLNPATPTGHRFHHGGGIMVVDAGAGNEVVLPAGLSALFSDRLTVTTGALRVGSLANVSGGELSGITIEVASGARLAVDPPVSVLNATLTLAGPGAEIIGLGGMRETRNILRLKSGAAFGVNGNLTLAVGGMNLATGSLLTVGGDFTAATDTTIDLQPDDIGVGRIEVAGTASVAAGKVTLLGSYKPSVDYEPLFLTASTVAGQFPPLPFSESSTTRQMFLKHASTKINLAAKPFVTLQPDLPSQFDTGVSTVDNITRLGTFTVRLQSQETATMFVRVNGLPSETFNAVAGQPIDVPFTGLQQAVYEVETVVRDAQGDESRPQTLSITVDTVPIEAISGRYNPDSSPTPVVEVGFDSTAVVNQLALRLTNLTTGASAYGTYLGSGRWRHAVPFPVDGDYTARLAAGGVSDVAGNPMVSDYVFDYFVLAGDASRDRSVNLDDLTILAANFGLASRTFTQGDFTYNGSVNLDDFTILASQFGKTLPAAGDVPRQLAQAAASAKPGQFSTAPIRDEVLMNLDA